jgi:superfamily I DNA/RNA helicase
LSRGGRFNYRSVEEADPDPNSFNPVAAALNDALLPQSVRVLACRDGQTLGQEGKVRVFNIGDIKGLEFEAVFFVGLDELAVQKPDLFDKYLYVGATRAATYLGVTCSGEELPARMTALERCFGDSWRADTPGLVPGSGDS